MTFAELSVAVSVEAISSVFQKFIEPSKGKEKLQRRNWRKDQLINSNINIKYELTQGYLILVSRPKLEYLYISLSGIINQKTLQQNCSQIISKRLSQAKKTH